MKNPCTAHLLRRAITRGEKGLYRSITDGPSRRAPATRASHGLILAELAETFSAAWQPAQSRALLQRGPASAGAGVSTVATAAGLDGRTAACEAQLLGPERVLDHDGRATRVHKAASAGLCVALRNPLHRTHQLPIFGRNHYDDHRQILARCDACLRSAIDGTSAAPHSAPF
jgi:hypothetical protein